DTLPDVRLDAKLTATHLDALERKNLDWREACAPKLTNQIEAILANRTTPALLARDPKTLSQDIQRLIDTLPHTAALARLRQVKAPEVAPLVISRWPQFTPSLRSKLIPLLLERESWTAELVKAIKQGTISPAEISLEQRKRLPDLFTEPTDRANALQ